MMTSLKLFVFCSQDCGSHFALPIACVSNPKTEFDAFIPQKISAITIHHHTISSAECSMRKSLLDAAIASYIKRNKQKMVAITANSPAGVSIAPHIPPASSTGKIHMNICVENCSSSL